VITVLAWLLPDQFGPGRVAAWSCYLAVFAAVFGWAALVTHWRGHQPKWWLDRRDRLRKAGLARPAVAVVAAVAALAVLAFIGRRL
jgi:hypothetical protein